MYSDNSVTEINLTFKIGIGLSYLAAFLVILMFVNILRCCSSKKTDDGRTKVTTLKHIEFSEEELNFDLHQECGRRIWQPFWENLFESKFLFIEGVRGGLGYIKFNYSYNKQILINKY
jgi:hypothetical protein